MSEARVLNFERGPREKARERLRKRERFEGGNAFRRLAFDPWPLLRLAQLTASGFAPPPFMIARIFWNYFFAV